MTASSRRPSSQSISSEGGTTSTSRRLARLRHLPSWPSTSHTATSRPASFNAATTFDPIKPAPPVDSMPGARAGIVWDLPRGRLAVAKQWGLASELRARGYGTALVLPRTWKAAIAPMLAGIPERVGFFGEARFGLINRMRWGEKALPRFIDKNAALALPAGAPLPGEWPVPQLAVSPEEIA